MKRDTNYKRDARKSRRPGQHDHCQSPPYAILPILPYLPKSWIIWEPARGEGLLSQSLGSHGYTIITSSIDDGEDFFVCQPDDEWQAIVTNPPWSLTCPWLERCYHLGRPFALLLKSEIITNQGVQKLMAQYGDLEHVFPETRINYKMPNKGWSGQAQFNTHWYTYGLNIGNPFTYLSPILQEKTDFGKRLK